MRCMTSPKFAVVVNGIPRVNIVRSRGLRQGCPLSPYLFLLCAEGLSSITNRAEVAGQVRGFACSRNSPTVSHLFFADYALFFSRADTNDADAILELLNAYEKALG